MKIHQITWNLYAQDDKIIKKRQLDKLLSLLEPDTDIILFSFQEVNNVKHIETQLKKYKFFKNFTLHVIDIARSTIYNRKFNVTLFLLISNDIDYLEITNLISTCMTRSGNKSSLAKLICTKGVAGFKLQDIRNKDTYLFMACHLPVFNLHSTESALKVINKTIEKHANSKTNIIIAGDFNSRLYIDNMMTRQLSKHYKSKTAAVRTTLKISKKKTWQRKSYKNKLVEENKKINKLTKNIVNNDKLNDEFSKLIKKHLKESKIKFLPTYKFNNNTGVFQKDYQKAIKFPGYADRIFYANLKPVKNSYQSIHVIGSDHMPVSITFK